MPGAVVFLADLPQGFHACTVIVKKAVDALITSQRVERLGNIGDRVQHHVILSVEIGALRTAFKPQGKKGKVVHKSLKNVTRVPLLSRLPDMGYFFRCDTALEISVAYLIAARYVGKRNGEVPPAVVRKPCLPTFSFRQYRIDTPFLQIGEQGRGRKRHDFQLLETRLRKGLLAKRERDGAHVRCLFLYTFQKVWHAVRSIEVRSQCDDVAALVECKIILLVPLGVHFERGFGFLPERRFVPEIDALPLHRAISQAVQVFFQSDLFCCLYVHK